MLAPAVFPGNARRSIPADRRDRRANGVAELVKSIGYDQGEIIRNILRLHAPEGRIDCDPTFSTGAFYNGTGVDPPALRFDIRPQAEGIVEADARHLPLEDSSISCMMLRI